MRVRGSRQPITITSTFLVLVILAFVFVVAVIATALPRPVISTCGGWSTRAPDGEALCLPLSAHDDSETPVPYHPVP